MSLDKLAIIFLIIILPISVVLSSYTRAQTETLNTQLAYDTKLNNATYDAIKSYQLNALNEDASNLGDVRIGNINAAVNTFYSSLSASLNMSGYNRAFLQDYVPALVFTMYDGYYIYSKYTNKLGDEDWANQAEAQNNGNQYASTYQDNQMLYGLKPFIHYSCRYKKGDDNDFVITYALDNYITIHGIINGKWIDDEGYLIDTSKISDINVAQKTLKYSGVEIKPEDILKEDLMLEGDTHAKTYSYHKVNGVKYYYDNSNNTWFSVMNGKRLNTRFIFDYNIDDTAFNYYYKAYTFTQRVTGETNRNDLDNNKCYGLNWLRPNNAYQVVLNEDGNSTVTLQNGDFLNQANKNEPIFNISKIEEPGSNFNEHRLAVIRYSIERNLSIAIKNYNQYKGQNGSIVQTEFEMPEFTEKEWDKIQSNICMISYLQGLPIGTKLYSGVSVISNNLNEEVVAEDSIYIASNENKNFYKITKKDWSSVSTNSLVGVLNSDMEKRYVETKGRDYYYYPKLFYSEYSNEYINLYSDSTNVSDGQYAYNGNIYKYLDNNLTGSSAKISQIYYTALGRERESSYKQQRNYQQLFNEN